MKNFIVNKSTKSTRFHKCREYCFFQKYSELLIQYNFSPSRIHDCDETGVYIVHNNSIKVISQKGKKQMSTIISRRGEMYILLSINATGNIFVPTVYFSQLTHNFKKPLPTALAYVSSKMFSCF